MIGQEGKRKRKLTKKYEDTMNAGYVKGPKPRGDA
jgi:hypothetical protein